MKKTAYVLGWGLFVLMAFYPAGVLAAAGFGYRFELISIRGFAIAIAALAVGAVILDIAFGYTFKSRAMGICAAAMAPLSLFCAFFYILESPRISVISSVLVCSLCCVVLAVRRAEPLLLKIAALSLSALMIMPIVFFSFLALIFGNLAQNTVVKTVKSPSEKHYAQVIDSDQGALGGDTLVDVYKEGLDLIIFKIEQKPQRVYEGDWGEGADMRIYWRDDNHLVIGSTVYKIE